MVGLGLVVYFAEKLVGGVVGTSFGFGISTFIISVVFIGFDPENLAVGAAGSFEGVSGIALGSIIGAAMVAIALAFGITTLIAPLSFEAAPRRILIVPVLAVVLLGVLALDGELGRLDGIILLAVYALSLVYLVWLSKHGLEIRPTGEVAETLDESDQDHAWKSFGKLVLSLAAIIAGSELLVNGSETIIAEIGLSDTVFGMTILALLVSIEELARELPAALKGRSEISYGNVVGSMLAFFFFNAGIISLVNPIQVNEQILIFYLPICFLTTVVVSAFMLNKRIPRWGGAVLLLLYIFFFIGAYLIA